MAVDVIMPKLGLTMDAGTVVEWLVAEGDRVEKGQTILEVETDKVIVEVESPGSGIMGPLLIGEGQQVPVGTILARIFERGEESTVRGAAAPARTELPEIEKSKSQNVKMLPREPATSAAGLERLRRPMSGTPGVRHRVFSSPRARKRAKELNVDWRTLRGSGPRGRIIERDVLRAEPAGGSTPPAVAQVPLAAQPVPAGFGSVPQLYLRAEAQMETLWEMHERLLPFVEQRAGVQLTITDWLVRIAGVALAQLPKGPVLGSENQEGASVGVVMLTPAWVSVPILQNVDRKSLTQIATERFALEAKTRAGKFPAGDLSAAVFVVASLETSRVDSLLATLEPGQLVLLTLGRIARRPVAVGSEIVVRRTAELTLACDRQVLDWASGSQLLGKVVELIEDPYRLLA